MYENGVDGTIHFRAVTIEAPEHFDYDKMCLESSLMSVTAGDE